MAREGGVEPPKSPGSEPGGSADSPTREWSGMQESNLLPLVPQTSALPMRQYPVVGLAGNAPTASRSRTERSPSELQPVKMFPSPVHHIPRCLTIDTKPSACFGTGQS